MKVLCLIPMDSDHRRLLESVDPSAEYEYVTDPKSLDAESLSGADVVIGNPDPALLKENHRLRLLQLQSAGTDGYTKEGVLPDSCTLCNASGAYGLAISEHMLAAVLMLMKKLHLYYEEQEKHAWVDHGSVTSIWNSRTLVVGLGDIGGEFAKRMHALGSRVTGIRRTVQEKPDYLEKLVQMDALEEELAEADIVAASLPSTKETLHLFNRERFARMKQGAIFVNVGRGTAVDQEALYEALESGHLGGAALDVTDPEPLPPEHPLWTAKNVIITPHISGWFHLQETYERIVRIAVENYRRLLSGEELMNRVDFSTGYRVLSARSREE